MRLLSLVLYAIFILMWSQLIWATPLGYRTSSEPISPVPQNGKLDKPKVKLGMRLFHDKRLSADNTLSCSSCHSLAHGGDDGLKKSIGINGLVGKINSPTVLNSGLSFLQFWDGRAKTLEEQIDGPILAKFELGSDWGSIIGKLSADSDYSMTFNKIYQTGITADNIRDAIATFERALNTPNARFDRYLLGEESAITEKEKEGYQLFKLYGCRSCHQGVAVGANMFEKMGIMKDYFADRGNITKADLGRFNITGAEEDRFKFKVPSLRNVELTSPYFHDGSTETLEEAVKVMARYQLGRKISQKDVDKIATFLRTLTGELPEFLHEQQ